MFHLTHLRATMQRFLDSCTQVNKLSLIILYIYVLLNPLCQCLCVYSKCPRQMREVPDLLLPSLIIVDSC